MTTMKTKLKILTTVFFAITVALTACGNNAEQLPFKYKMVGKTNYIPDQEKIILAHGFYDGKQPTGQQIITTMTVKNGSFGYEGNANLSEACMLYIPSEGAYMPVILERGTILVAFDRDPDKTAVHGTPLNDSLQMLAKKNLDCAAKFQSMLKNTHNPPLPEEVDVIQEYRSNLLREIGTIHYQCAMRNINNELGFFLTISSHEFFTRKQLQTLLNHLPENKHNHPAVKRLEYTPDMIIPSFSLLDNKGYSYNVKSLVKQFNITIIDFWASWCKPCMDEMPNLIYLNQKYGNRGLGIVGVSLDEDKMAWTNACKTIGNSWIQLWDKDGAAADLFQIKTIPHTFVVNKNGEVMATKLRGKELVDFIASHLQ